MNTIAIVILNNCSKMIIYAWNSVFENCFHHLKYLNIVAWLLKQPMTHIKRWNHFPLLPIINHYFYPNLLPFWNNFIRLLCYEQFTSIIFFQKWKFSKFNTKQTSTSLSNQLPNLEIQLCVLNLTINIYIKSHFILILMGLNWNFTILKSHAQQLLLVI